MPLAGGVVLKDSSADRRPKLWRLRARMQWQQ